MVKEALIQCCGRVETVGRRPVCEKHAAARTFESFARRFIGPIPARELAKRVAIGTPEDRC